MRTRIEVGLLGAVLATSACGPDLHSFGFLPARRAALSPATGGGAVADVDGDGRVDLVTLEDTRLALRLGAADGSFAARREIAVPGTLGGALQAVAAGDVNRDGRPDLVLLRTLIGDKVQALLTGAAGVAESSKETSVASVTAVTLALGDVDRDGSVDLALAEAPVSGEFRARVLRGNGDGTFAEFKGMATYKLKGDPRIALADVNKDGKLDLVWTALNRALALVGAGDGSFATMNNFPVEIGAVGGLATFDLNRDGHADVLGPSAPDGVSVLLSRRDGTTFGDVIRYGVGLAPAWVAAGDVDGDRLPDLIAVSTDQVAVRRNASQ